MSIICHKDYSLVIDGGLVLTSGLNPAWETNPVFFTAKVGVVAQSGAGIYDLRTVTSITRVGTTATVTIPSHQFHNGQAVSILGATPAGYNTLTISPVTGLVVISGVTANTFTYTLSSDPGVDASGTITCRGFWTTTSEPPGPFGFNGLPAGSRQLIAVEGAGGSVPKFTTSAPITQVVTAWPASLWSRDFATWANTFRGLPVGTFTGQMTLTGLPGRTYREVPAGAGADYFELVYSGGTVAVGLDLIYGGGSTIVYIKDPADPLQPIGVYNYVSGAGTPPATIHVTAT